MSDYATVTQIKAFANQPDSLGGGADDTSWALLATAASRLFDNLAEVSDSFFAITSGDFTARDFIGDGTAYLKLDPYTVLNTYSILIDESEPVLINDGTIDDADFTDDNVPEYVARGGALIVLTKTNQHFLNTTPAVNRFTGWPDGVQIRVSAKWGFTAIPSDITFAVIQMALQMFRTGDPATMVLTDTAKAINNDLPVFVKETARKYRELYSSRSLFA